MLACISAHASAVVYLGSNAAAFDVRTRQRNNGNSQIISINVVRSVLEVNTVRFGEVTQLQGEMSGDFQNE